MIRGFRRIWLVGAMVWALYWVGIYWTYCHYPSVVQPHSIICRRDWWPGGYQLIDPSMFYYTLSSVLTTAIFGVIALTGALWALSWILRGFQPSQSSARDTLGDST